MSELCRLSFIYALTFQCAQANQNVTGFAGRYFNDDFAFSLTIKLFIAKFNTIFDTADVCKYNFVMRPFLLIDIYQMLNSENISI